jgi:hypothetical protein
VAVVATAPLAAKARRPLGANTNDSIATSATKNTPYRLGKMALRRSTSSPVRYGF